MKTAWLWSPRLKADDSFEIAVDLSQWMVGFNCYRADYGNVDLFNLFVGPIRLGLVRRTWARRLRTTPR